MNLCKDVGGTTRRAALLLGLGLLTALPAAAHADDSYPNRPIRFVIAWPPGGGTDACARVVAQLLSEQIGQPVIVESHAGASGQVGTEYVARAEPDGYTLQYTVADSHAIIPHLYKNVRYDAHKDFIPVMMLGGGMPNALTVNPDVPADTVQEFVDLAKKDPGKYTYASWGIGSGGQIRMEYFADYEDIDLLHVPYTGSGPGLNALIAGQVDAMMVPLGMAVSHHKAGTLKILAIDTPERWPATPDVATFKEQGIPITFSFWQGVLAPAGTPPEIVDYLNKQLSAALTKPGAYEALLKVGMVMGQPGEKGLAVPPEEVRAFFDEEYDRWGTIIKNANIPIQ